jgi:hypothetical protein
MSNACARRMRAPDRREQLPRRMRATLQSARKLTRRGGVMGMAGRMLAVGMTVIVLGIGSVFGASELGGEVVTLDTVDASGAHRATHLWVVDDAGFAWLRSGAPGSEWLARIDANPDVEVERGGVLQRVRAVPVRQANVRDRIHALMREKYGWADRLISGVRDPARSVAVRLEPVSPSP